MNPEIRSAFSQLALQSTNGIEGVSATAVHAHLQATSKQPPSLEEVQQAREALILEGADRANQGRGFSAKNSSEGAPITMGAKSTADSPLFARFRDVEPRAVKAKLKTDALDRGDEDQQRTPAPETGRLTGKLAMMGASLKFGKPPKRDAEALKGAAKRVDGEWKVPTKDKPRITPAGPLTGRRANASRPTADEDPNIYAAMSIHDVRKHIQVDGNDTPSLLKNLRFMLTEPVHPTAEARAREAAQQLPASAPLTRETVNELRTIRMEGSSTMRDGNTQATQARANWDRADRLVFRAAGAAGAPSADEVLQLMSDVNATLGNGVFDRGGELRLNSDVSAGVDAAPDSREHPTRLYLPGSEVESAMQGLAQDIARGLEQKEDPIALAARTYQTMVSIHPFHDANGRTARFMMDYVLMRSGLLPAALGEDVNVACFCRLSPDSQPSSTGALNIVRAGVERSYEAVTRDD